MKILVLSDSHYEPIELSLKEYDMVLHCGDYGMSSMKNINFVRGNCDISGDKEREFILYGRRIWMTHGDHYNVKYGYDRICYRAMELGVEVCFFGHTHIPTLFKESNILFINPGAYRDGYYVVIEDNVILFYKENKMYKKFEFKW